MIEWLGNKGHHCTVLTTYPYYPHWKVQEPFRNTRYWYKTDMRNFESGGSIRVIRCPIYVPSQPTGTKRIILDFTFLFTSFFPLVALLFSKKFNLLIAVAPSFLIGLPAVFYKWFRGGRFLYHIQDMQIEAARDLGMIKSKVVLNVLFAIEKFICRKASVISSISDGMMNKLKQKFNREIYFFPNWTDITQFFPIENKQSIKADFGFVPTDFVFLYSGGIGQKQGLESIIEAAIHFRTVPKAKFVICGSGPYKVVLQRKVAENNLENVLFFPLQPLEKFNAFLNMADIHLVIQKANASDLMLPSKLTTILAVGGVPLITANQGSGLHSLVTAHRVGILVEAENQEALNAALETILHKDINVDTIRTNSRLYAEIYLDIGEIMKRFEADQCLC